MSQNGGGYRVVFNHELISLCNTLNQSGIAIIKGIFSHEIVDLLNCHLDMKQTVRDNLHRPNCLMDCSLVHTKYTVEVGSLHTLRLESFQLIFQPLHTFLVNKLIYFVHVTSHFSKNCLQTDYFTYNSLYHNSSGSEVYIH